MSWQNLLKSSLDYTVFGEIFEDDTHPREMWAWDNLKKGEGITPEIITRSVSEGVHYGPSLTLRVTKMQSPTV
jgi:hypothetical protein